MTRELNDSSTRQGVARWYDEFGWQKNETGTYNDTALFSQDFATAHGKYESASHPSFLDKFPGGDFFLDAASGPITHSEYLAYSRRYRYHVCVDASFVALREAKAKLKDKGLCCVADIARLPFQEETFDDIASNYTIQHIDKTQQSQAVRELYRTLKEDGHLCIIAEVQRSVFHRTLILAMRALWKFWRILSNYPRHHQQGQPVLLNTPGPLYFYARDLSWWRNQARDLTSCYSLRGLRIFSKNEFERFWRQSGRATEIIQALESLFPRIAARMCAYLLVDIVKSPSQPRKSARSSN